MLKLRPRRAHALRTALRRSRCSSALSGGAYAATSAAWRRAWDRTQLTEERRSPRKASRTTQVTQFDASRRGSLTGADQSARTRLEQMPAGGGRRWRDPRELGCRGRARSRYKHAPAGRLPDGRRTRMEPPRTADDATPGQHAVGGGVRVDEPSIANILDSYPDAANTAWTGRAYAGPAPVNFTVYAICTTRRSHWLNEPAGPAARGLGLMPHTERTPGDGPMARAQARDRGLSGHSRSPRRCQVRLRGRPCAIAL